jgi:hypothetical protein
MAILPVQRRRSRCCGVVLWWQFKYVLNQSEAEVRASICMC